jgi:hypothetical protein
MSASAFTLSALVICTLVSSGHAGTFRGQGPSVEMDEVQTNNIRATLLSELMDGLGKDHHVTEARYQKLEDALRPIFASLPKNAQGNLESPSVRYALHRIFAQRHGMFVKGLEPDGKAWNSSSPAQILEEKVPAFVQGLFEERLGGQGFGLHELAVLAATLEHLIHDEALDRLRHAYQALGLPLEGALASSKVEEAIDTYMMIYLFGKHGLSTTQEVEKKRSTIALEYPNWPKNVEFLRDVQRDFVKAKQADASDDFSGDQLSFSTTGQIVEEVGERFGRWQDSECRELKDTLLTMEDKSAPGRVLLKEFYGNALSGGWQFSESPAYLRELGALDESDSDRPRVIVSNYVNSPSNCLASSSFYSVCCIDECEDLMGHIEQQIAEPEGEPERIAQVVAALPSATVTAPRRLPDSLLGRLGEIAQHHNGRVPLHGRLFAQWMHHAYPRECRYPHVSGAVATETSEAWRERNMNETEASKEEMEQHASSEVAPVPDVHEEDVQLLPWSMEEELVIARAPSQASTLRGAMRSFMMLAALAAFALSIKSTFTSAVGGKGSMDLPFHHSKCKTW